MEQTLRFMRGNVMYGALLASALVAFLSITSLFITPVITESLATMRIEPSAGRVMLGDTFTIQVVVESSIPVNVFKGEVRFDHNVLSVASIDYNTSIADLWAELPWYENGEGTVNFAGGTTRKGGFHGTGSLITITFRAKTSGNTALNLTGARILEHNGLGTDVPLEGTIDAIFAVEESIINEQTIASPEETTSKIAVTPKVPNTDLNGDGKQTIADVSIFMINILGTDPRYDFNFDGVVDTKDMSILMSS